MVRKYSEPAEDGSIGPVVMIIAGTLFVLFVVGMAMIGLRQMQPGGAPQTEKPGDPVAQVRSPAGRAQSQNHLKQIGIAIHTISVTYESKMPPSVGTFPADNPREPKGTFWFHILPYIEQDNVFRANRAEPDQAKETIKIYASPSDPSNPVTDTRLSYASNFSVFGDKTQNYIAKLGVKGLSNTVIVVERYSVIGETTCKWPSLTAQHTYVQGPTTTVRALASGQTNTTPGLPLNAAWCLSGNSCQVLMGDGSWHSVPPNSAGFLIAIDANNKDAPPGDW